MAGPITVSTAAYDGYELAVAIDEIATLGCSHVELAYIKGYVAFDESEFSDTNAARVVARLKAAGLASAAVSAHVNAALPEAPELLRRRIGFAQRTGAGMVITNAGPSSLRTAILGTIEHLLPELEAQQMVLAFENPGHGEGDVLANGRDAAEFARQIGSPWIRINYDIGNVWTYSHEKVRPEDDIDAVTPYLAHLHAKDIRTDPDGWSFTAIGDGAIDYRAVLKKAAALECPIGLELPLRLRRPGRRDPSRSPDPLPLDVIRAAVQRSLAFVQNQLAR
jgi:sugar phosphate isomerase/epimerase